MTSHTSDLAPLAREWQRVEDELQRRRRTELTEILRLMFFFGARTHSMATGTKLVLMNMELREFDKETTGI